MSPVYSVTYVAGLDHPDLLPARGEKERAVRRGNSMNLLAAQLGAAFLAPRAGRGRHGNEENPISAR
jgi:hypothetical protein